MRDRLSFTRFLGLGIEDGIPDGTTLWLFRETLAKAGLVEKLFQGGMETIAAMHHAAEQRMSPMLMTALSACIGLLPAAISSGIGSQVQRPLATVVVGGMLIGPIIMLVVVPALQTLFLERRDRPEREAREDGEDFAEV